MKNLIKKYTDDNFIVIQYLCLKPCIAIGMHEHPPQKSHYTGVVSGSIKIHDGEGWEDILQSGQTIDLNERLKHEIITLEPNTIFENRYNFDGKPEEIIEELKEFHGTQTYERNICFVDEITFFKYKIENDNTITITLNISVMDNHCPAILEMEKIESEKMFLKLSCSYGDLTQKTIYLEKNFPFDPEVKQIVLKWLAGRAETILDIT